MAPFQAVARRHPPRTPMRRSRAAPPRQRACRARSPRKARPPRGSAGRAWLPSRGEELELHLRVGVEHRDQEAFRGRRHRGQHDAARRHEPRGDERDRDSTSEPSRAKNRTSCSLHEARPVGGIEPEAREVGGVADFEASDVAAGRKRHERASAVRFRVRVPAAAEQLDEDRACHLALRRAGGPGSARVARQVRDGGPPARTTRRARPPRRRRP